MGTQETLDLGAMEALVQRAVAGLLATGREASVEAGTDLWRAWPGLRKALEGARAVQLDPKVVRGEAFALVRRAAHVIEALRAENARLRAELEQRDLGDPRGGRDTQTCGDESVSRT